MEKLLRCAIASLQAGEELLLATVIESTGSTPRSAGAYMLVGKEGRLQGTIGGGMLEFEATKKGQQQIALQDNFLFHYTLTMEGAANLGMICGGSCTVLYYYLGNKDLAVLEQCLQSAVAGRPYWLALPLGQGQTQYFNELELASRRGRLTLEGAEYFAEQFAYDGRLHIFGGGHLAQELVPVLARLDFRMVVYEDRAEFATHELFPQAEEIILQDFNTLQLQLGPNDYAAVMTRGHQHDAIVERLLLKTPACYIGVVGSRRKAALTRATLLQEGFSQAELDRIITPIGLEIDSETPAEIAISIAAQLIQVRAKKFGKN